MSKRKKAEAVVLIAAAGLMAGIVVWPFLSHLVYVELWPLGLFTGFVFGRGSRRR